MISTEETFYPRELLTCPVDSDLYRMMVARMKSDGRWKALPRHIPTKADLMAKKAMKDRIFAPADMPAKKSQQVWSPYKDDSEFTDGI